MPAVEMRVISNAVRHADRSLWRIEDALATLGQAVPRVVSALRR